MKTTIIGGGNMGGATALGLVKAGRIPASEITVTARHSGSLEKFAAAGICTTTDNIKAVAGADIVILAVKPFMVSQVIEQIRPVLDYSRQTIVSFAAGISSAQLQQWLDKDGQKPGLVLVIPNTAIELCQSMTFVANAGASDSQLASVMELFDGTGITMQVSEKQLAGGMTLASCGIAYAMRYIRASAEGGVELGFYPKDAVRIVCQTVLGAAGLILEHGSNPEDEIDKVTTPGGFTIRGLNAMEAAGFTAAVQSGLKPDCKK